MRKQAVSDLRTLKAELAQKKINTSLQSPLGMLIYNLSKNLTIVLLGAVIYINHKFYIFSLFMWVLQSVSGNIRCKKAKWCLFGYF